MKSKAPRETVFHQAAHRLFSSAGLIVAGGIIASSFIITLFLASPGLIGTQFAAVVTSRLVSLTNDDRSGEGLGTLTISPTLTAAAQAKANDMAAKGYFAHVSPDGRTSWSWFQDAGYKFTYAGENLAVDFTDSGDVNKAWLNSPTHRANIMNGHFTQIGIATAEGTYEGHPTVFVVQMFGTPQAANVPAPQGTLSSNSLPSNPSQPALAVADKPETTVLGSSVGPKVVPSNAADAQQTVTSHSVNPSSAGTAPAPVAVTQSAPTHIDSPLDAAASSPRNFLRDIYIFLGIILAAALLLRTRLEFKLHHARHAFAALLLVVFMGGLFVVADRVVFVSPVIGAGASF